MTRTFPLEVLHQQIEVNWDDSRLNDGSECFYIAVKRLASMSANALLK